jgi:pimeloyl-ACP methyl ester carboxylesterase
MKNSKYEEKTKRQQDKKQKKKWSPFKKFLRIFAIVLGVIIVAMGVFASVFAYRNMHANEELLKEKNAVFTAGFEEKQVQLDSGTLLNYAEGPDNGPGLLLIHGQCMQWEDYSRVLPELSKHSHVFAVDCHGHGETSHDPSRYTGVAMGQDFVWFIQNVIGEKCVVSGHSSGGILTAWIAANAPEDVLGIVLEDLPFFSVTPEEMQNTFVWLESFVVVHSFLNQTAKNDYVVYHLEHSYLWGLFGNLRDLAVKNTREYRAEHPGESLELWYIPHSMLHGETYMNGFDLEFADTFYTGSWFEGLDQAEALSKVNCPSVYIKAETQYGKDGVLYAANTDDDAAKVNSLLKDNEVITIKSGHDVHYEHSKEFIKVFISFLDKIET